MIWLLTTQAVLDAGACDENCEHCHRWFEPRPYGSTYAMESMFECTADFDTECPVVRRHSDDLHLESTS